MEQRLFGPQLLSWITFRPRKETDLPLFSHLFAKALSSFQRDSSLGSFEVSPRRLPADLTVTDIHKFASFFFSVVYSWRSLPTSRNISATWFNGSNLLEMLRMYSDKKSGQRVNFPCASLYLIAYCSAWWSVTSLKRWYQRSYTFNYLRSKVTTNAFLAQT